MKRVLGMFSEMFVVKFKIYIYNYMMWEYGDPMFVTFWFNGPLVLGYSDPFRKYLKKKIIDKEISN